MGSEHCPHCGTAVEPTASYCSACGDAVTETTSSASETDPNTLAALTHLLGLMTWVIGPLVVLLATEDAFVEANARRAVDWQLMLTIYLIISAILVLLIVGIAMLVVFSFLNLIFCIVAAVKASEGEVWQYPLTPSLT